MAFPTPGQIDQLAAVDAAHLIKLIDLAIAEIAMKGQHVTADGRQLGRGDLESLRKMRNDLVASADPAPADGTMGGVLRPRFPNDP